MAQHRFSAAIVRPRHCCTGGRAWTVTVAEPVRFSNVAEI